MLSRLRVRTGFPLTLPSESLSAGPHERFRHSTTRSAFCPTRSFRRTESSASTSATNVKVEHTRERPVTPRTDVLSAGARPSKACGRQSTGYPVGSRASALPVAPTRPSFGTRHERPARNRRRAPKSDGVAAECPERHRLAARPKARLRPAARTVRPSNEPGCLRAVWNRGSSPRPLAGSIGAERRRPFFTRPAVSP
jgi:hypothetical protein